MAEVVDVRARVLAANEEAAAGLRRAFSESGALVLNLISSPGSGKTTLLEATVRALGGRLRLAGIEGDIATERDADRLKALGIPAVQILTGGACHLDARQVRKVMDEARFPDFDILFIENVGNLICPTSYDLGEDFKVALLSVTEGDDKPFKYPAIFARAEVTVVTKVDLLPHVSFDLAAVREQLASLNPTGTVVLTSARTGEGIPEWCVLLERRLAAKRGTRA
ncbi:MAG TPA: hydrogenase nickel incorporation protein HypB [Thermoanaerobaculaceae bacterium]|nr:hydrogenase nickel incorporation protein HypB [Thermoanaerobaculaceae bacterium]